MARRIPTRLNLLTVRQVQTAGDGDHNDGGGLVLRVRGSSVAWVFRFTSPIGKRREMGLGICDRNNPTIAGRSLTDARKLGQDARALLQESIDPIDARDARKAALRAEAEEKKSEARREQLTLARAARRYHEGTIEPSRSVKHGGEWIRSLENHMPGAIWHKPISEATAPELLDFMSELFGNVPETARRILQRLTVVFDDAMFRGECLANPAAAIKRKLREARRGTKRGNFAAMAYAKVPAFIQALRQVEGVAARCLEFTIYTASRTHEALGARWDWIQNDTNVDHKIRDTVDAAARAIRPWLSPGTWRTAGASSPDRSRPRSAADYKERRVQPRGSRIVDTRASITLSDGSTISGRDLVARSCNAWANFSRTPRFASGRVGREYRSRADKSAEAG